MHTKQVQNKALNNKTHKQHKAKLPNTEHANHQNPTLHFTLLLYYSLMILLMLLKKKEITKRKI
jgi:hypothetical protein